MSHYLGRLPWHGWSFSTRRIHFYAKMHIRFTDFSPESLFTLQVYVQLSTFFVLQVCSVVWTSKSNSKSKLVISVVGTYMWKSSERCNLFSYILVLMLKKHEHFPSCISPKSRCSHKQRALFTGVQEAALQETSAWFAVEGVSLEPAASDVWEVSGGCEPWASWLRCLGGVLQWSVWVFRQLTQMSGRCVAIIMNERLRLGS